ncbi:MAG: radical SAM protein [Chloroflexota bacterium]
MKVMLLFPPNWTPTMPHLALPTLTAYLRQNGVEVVQRDLNLEVFDEILTKEYLRKTVTRLRQEYGREQRNGSPKRGGPKRGRQIDGQQNGHSSRLKPHPDQIRWAIQKGPQIANQIEKAKEGIRSTAFYDGPIGLRNFQIMAEALELASLPYFPASLHLQSYEAAGPVDSSKTLLELVQDRQTNIFINLFERGIIQDIKQEQPDVVGISIPSMPQMLAGMTVAHLIKEAGLACHVTVGGPHISMLREELPNAPQMFDLFDSAVVFDGEEPLLRLVETVTQGGDLATVPNLVYRDRQNGDKIGITERKTPDKITDLPLPDFDGLPLGKYLAPEPALPLLTARGCYFGKCAFCNVGYGEPETFSQLRAQNLADQMNTLCEKYGVKHIFFSDEAITPRNLRDLAPILQEQGSPVHWGGCVRFEKYIDNEILDNAYQGGCRMILFGLESASDAIMDQMVKGTQLPHVDRILKEAAEAGIWNHTFFFFGFPGETIEDAQETVNFLYRHKHHINSAAMGTFLMERYSPAHRFPQSFGVKRIIQEPDKDLAIYFDYEVESGMDERMSDRVAESFLSTLPDKRYPQYYVSDVYRFLYASYLSERGIPKPAWLVPEEAVT